MCASRASAPSWATTRWRRGCSRPSAARAICSCARWRRSCSPENRKPPEEGGFPEPDGASEVVVVVGQALLQATLFEQVVDDAALGQVGLGHFHHLLGGVVAFDEIIIQFEFGFVAH